MNEYLLFAGRDYCPGGGMEDYQGDFKTIKEAVSKFKELKLEWYHVVSRSDMKTRAGGSGWGENNE